MHERARALIHSLKLSPHPEGGFFAEVHRSPLTVTCSIDAGERAASTSIYYLLVEGTCSRWHVLPQDEVWRDDPRSAGRLRDRHPDLAGML